MLRSLRPGTDLKKAGRLTFEVTPPTAEDSYGGWWVSVYDEAELDSSRASPTELEDITVAKKDVAASEAGPAAGGSPNPLVGAAPGQTPTGGASPTPGPGAWTADDLKAARPGGGSGDRVYVHGYTRKDGTYVHPHTRSAPSGGRRK